MPPRPFRPLSRRSGRIPALPYPPLRCFQSGSTTTSPTTLLHLTAITPLTSCRAPRVHFIRLAADWLRSLLHLEILAPIEKFELTDTGQNQYRLTFEIKGAEKVFPMPAAP